MTSKDSTSASTSSLNDRIMNDELDNGCDELGNQLPIDTFESEIAGTQSDLLSTDSTINPLDEERQFIYDNDTSRLTCVGSNFDDIPQDIIDTFSLKTKILDLSKNRFRSLACIQNFTNLEELILDNNDLDDNHTSFPKLPHLQTLMLNKNHFQDIYKLIEQLRHAYPMLTHLSLLGNEACPYQIIATSQTSSNNKELSSFAQNRLDEEYQRYRHLLVFRLPTLKFLDASEISFNERRVSTQLGDILYSIVETKQMQSLKTNSEKELERDDQYTPLPNDVDSNHKRIAVGKIRHVYHGEGSQGNKFVQDGDL